MVSPAQAASVGPGGYTNDFSSQPVAADWATASRAGGSQDGYVMDTEINEVVNAAAITAELSASSGNPPTQDGFATWSSAGQYVQTRPTGNRYTLLLAKFTNETGTNATLIEVSYGFTIAAGGTAEEAGTRVYYSRSGLPGSWVNVPALNTVAFQNESFVARGDFETDWTNGTSLYLLWADDNADGSGSDAANQFDNFSLRVLDGNLPALMVAVTEPTNNAVFLTGNAIAATAHVSGRPPYTVEYFTNSGVGNLEFSSAGSSTAAPFEVSLGSLAAGTYNIFAVVTDSATPAASVTSATNTFVVVDPLVVILSPADGALFESDEGVFATAAISGGTPPYSAQFHLDDLPSGELITSAPYEREFGALFVGDHRIRVSVVDARGWASNSETHRIQVTGPLAVMLTPTNGAGFFFGEPIVLSAEVGGGTGPYSVTFYTNGQPAGAVGFAPFTLDLGILPPGIYTSYVHAIDSSAPEAQELYSTTNVFQVTPNNFFVFLFSPADGSVALEGRSLTLNASAFVDAPFTITSVQFFYEEALVGVDTSEPYSALLTSHEEGTRNIYAAATDSFGRTRYSATNRISVLDGGPVPNDNFANAIPLTGPAANVVSHNLTATKEPGEPSHHNLTGSGSVWWTWTPSTSGPATIDTFGSDYDTVLAVYVGTALNQLTLIGSNDDASGLQSQVQFNATAGTVYRVAVDGFSSSSRGLIRLNIRGAGGVQMIAPTNGMIVTLGDPITVTASILPDFPNPPPARVDFYSGGSIFASLTNGPFTVTITNAPAGSNTFYVVAWDSQGTRLQSSTATVFVQAIGVMILNPLSGTVFSTTNPIAINTWTHLPEGSITNVEFFVNGAKIGEDNTPPFSAIWNTVVGGSHRLFAVGRSDAGVSYQSAAVNIGVIRTFVPFGSVWRFLDDGSDQGTNWTRPDFDDSSWQSGLAPFGFGDSGGRFPTTPNATGRVTYYYRHRFVVTNVAGLNYVDGRIERDDGAIVYLNGQEIDRDNLPFGPVSYTDYAQTAFDDGQFAFFIFANRTALVEGTNVLAVEVHRDGPTDTDLWFQMSLSGYPLVIFNQPPLVSMSNPTNDQYYLAPGSITLEAEASDPETSVGLVEFFVDGVKIGEDASEPYSVVWQSPSIGAHVVSARATDDQGSAGMSLPVSIVVYNAVGTPLGQITSPANGAVMEGPTNLVVTAAAHALGGVDYVQFLANGEVIDEDDSAPYSAIWAAPFGSNVLRAIAFDANGASGTSAAVAVTITIPPTNVIGPRVISQFPLAGSTLTSLTNITVRFSEYVQNVDASDLLINGAPASSVDASQSRSNYTFSFPQPAYGAVSISWAPNHGITDYGWPAVLPFDEAEPGGSWDYTLIDVTPPTIVARTPEPGATVTNLVHIFVTFSEDVSGVDAADLRLNGIGAVAVTGSGSNYVFTVTQPPPGVMSVGWALDHNIFDLAATPNPFNRTGVGSTWSFTFDTRTILVQSNSSWRFVRGTNEASAPSQAWRQPDFDDSWWSESPAPFFYGDPYNSFENPGTLLFDMENGYSTVYMRTEFEVTDRGLITNIWLNAQSDDGFIAWINGVEVRRYNAPPGEVPYFGIATVSINEPQNRGAAYIIWPLPNAVDALVDGRNVLAIHALNRAPSSDFGFNAQLYTHSPDASTVAPGLYPPNPPEGDVLSLTNIVLSFTEPVTGVDAADLLVNGVPANALTAIANTTYSFNFDQPSSGPVLITWDVNHGIADFDARPRAFDQTAPGSVLRYHLINPRSPRILTQAPLAGSTVTGLTAVVITFDEPVSGVDAVDLLIAGAPAESVAGIDATNYTFTFRQPPSGLVTVRWTTNHGIADLEAGNTFDPARFGGEWDYLLVDPTPSVMITSPTNGSYRLAPATVTVTAIASDYDGTVERVEFYSGGNLLGEATHAPYSIVLSNLAVGSYVFSAAVTDNTGLIATSAPVVLNVVTSLPAFLVRGPYLQVGTPTSGIVRWRTDVATDGMVYYGTDALELTNIATEATLTNEHIVQISGLEPGTKYYYSIGSSAQRLAGTNGPGSEYWFKTSPLPGTPQPTRIWVLGDPGSAGSGPPDRQNRTRDAFYNFAAATRPADLWLILGDNAYNAGTDVEYQRAVFNIYPATLRNLFLWPAIGDRETDPSLSATDFPYLHIFSLPQNGEAGGVPSGTEKYYSFDYGNIHFVCLDSMSSGRTAVTPMAQWLRADLAAASAQWIIVFFHHPPYTKGNHDSDSEQELIDIRQNLVPILEAHGVDLVLSGHSHGWERSYLLHGHYGLSSTLTDEMKIDAGDGREGGTGAYRKNEGGHGIVYAVAGNAGQVSGGTVEHPAHYLSLKELGSMVIDVNSNRLDAIFLREDGEIRDRFTLIKPDLRPDGPVHLVATPTGDSQIRLDWADMAENEAGYSIERSVDGLNFVEHVTAAADVITALDTGLVENVTYFYRVRATNSIGASDYSNIASITPGSATSPPEAPGSLVAISDDGIRFYRSQMILTWEDRSSSEAAFQIERSRDGLTFVPVGTVGANIGDFVDGGLDSATFYFYRVRAINAAGGSSASEVALDQTHPQSQVVRAGESVSFHAGEEGTLPISYEWRFRGYLIPGETNIALTIGSAELADQGDYSVLIRDGSGPRVSNPATLVVVAPPRIIAQPEDAVRGVGMSVEFTIAVDGSAPFNYYWSKDGVAVGPNAPSLSLPAVALTDEGGYQVVVENDFGAATSRVAMLRVYSMPALEAVRDLLAEVLRPLIFTNVVVDENMPPLDLRFALDPGAPTNAYINPRTGVFRFTPNRAQGPGTYAMTVSVFDEGYPFLRDSTSFNVVVNDFAELRVGSLVLLASTNGLTPLSLFSTLAIREMEATISFQGEYFSDITLEQAGVQSLTGTFQRLDANTARLAFSASGAGLTGSNYLGALRVAARPLTNSTAVPVRITSLTGSSAVPDAAPSWLSTPGRVVIVGTRPLLEGYLSAQGARELTLYGRPGIFVLQYSTNLFDPVWRTRANVSVNSNLSILVRPGTVPPTNMPSFFRLRQ